METIYHQLHDKPYYFPDWKVKHLFIGTFNPSGGESVNYYYGRSRNQTWKLIAAIFGDHFDQSSLDSFLQTIKKHEIACVDMIHAIRVSQSRLNRIIGKGYKDTEIINNSVIREYNTDKILSLIAKNKGIKVYSTWGIGPKLKEWRNEVAKIQQISSLVSPSMAARVPKGANKFDYMLTDWKEKINNNLTG